MTKNAGAPEIGLGLRPINVIASDSEAIHSFLLLLDGLLRRSRLRPKAGFGGQERSSQ
jgi:hypothetical protein